jgi:hypothetical protein
LIFLWFGGHSTTAESPAVQGDLAKHPETRKRSPWERKLLSGGSFSFRPQRVILGVGVPIQKALFRLAGDFIKVIGFFQMPCYNAKRLLIGGKNCEKSGYPQEEHPFGAPLGILGEEGPGKRLRGGRLPGCCAASWVWDPLGTAFPPTGSV